MSRQVALIRGINVGRAKRVAMADLRAIVESLGCTDVRTLLNSGNVVFTNRRGAAPAAAARIEKELAKRLGIAARVAGLEAAEVARIVAGNPLLETARDLTRLFAYVLMDPADRRRLKGLLDEDWGSERLALGARVAYLWCPDGLLESRLPEAVNRALGDAVTARNWATMTKLHALVGVLPDDARAHPG